MSRSHPHPRRSRRLAAMAVTLTSTTLSALVFAAGSASAVVGGEPVDITSVPWQVSLQDPSSGHFCGGSILSPTLVLTAAHCTVDTPASGIVVRAGSPSLSSGSAQTVGVSAIFENPAYLQGYATDVSVLVLSTPLVLGSNVQPIQLASSADLAGATSATTSGWGVTSETASDVPDQLLVATVPLVDDAACQVALAPYDSSVTASSETCAGGTGTDSCYGDSGGPLVVLDANGVPKLAGVVSWGVECGGSAPGVYAEVPALATWITGITPDTPPADRATSSGCGIVDPETGEPADDSTCDDWMDDGWFGDPGDDATGDDGWDDSGYDCVDDDGDGWCDDDASYDDSGYDAASDDTGAGWDDAWCDEDAAA